LYSTEGNRKKLPQQNNITMRFLTILSTLVLAFNLSAQDCQLVAMHVDIPAGISKHHFPMQAMPAVTGDDYFTYLAEWNEGDLTIRIRFSEDGNEWTNWQVLKRDFCMPEIKASPLNIANNKYEYFEWAVYNKAGLESDLTFNFYFPTVDSMYATTQSNFPLEISTVGCPQPKIIPTTSGSSVVSANEEK